MLYIYISNTIIHEFSDYKVVKDDTYLLKNGQHILPYGNIYKKRNKSIKPERK